MASEVKTENVMLDGLVGYFRKTGTMTNYGTLELNKALVTRTYDEGYVGPNSILKGTDLADTSEYLECKYAMKDYLGNYWVDTESERDIIANTNVLKELLLPYEKNIQNIVDRMI